MVALIIVAVVVVLMIIALPFAKRRDIRKGHSPRSMGDIKSSIRKQRLDLRTTRRLGYSASDQRRRPGKKSS